MIKATLTILGSFFAPKLRDVYEETRFSLVVLPWHLDLNFHVNNARYLNFCNQARLVHLAKFNFFSILKNEKAKPVIRNLDISYYKSLKLFDHFTVVTKLVEVSDSQIAMEHAFWKGDDLVAMVVCEAILISKNGKIDAENMIDRYFGK